MNMHADPLVDDYLRRLDAAASALPAHRRDELASQIRDHLQEALRRAPAGDKEAVRNVLERLGPPEEIAAAATESAPPGQLASGSARSTAWPSRRFCWIGITILVAGVILISFHPLKNNGRGNDDAIASVITRRRLPRLA